MAASNLNLGKASGGVLNVQPADGTTTTSLVLPAINGTVVAADSNGNVGIGTSSPISKLSISGYLNSQDSNNNGALYLGQYLNANGAYGGFEWNNTAGILGLRTKGAYPINFTTNNTERMRIDSAGNVGIGTSNPARKLEVQSYGVGAAGILRISGFAGSGSITNASLLELSITGAGGGTVTQNLTARYNNGYEIATYFADRVSWRDNATNTQLFAIDSSGNVLVTSSGGGLGYGTGAGGTVTQLTSKGTAVTLNKPCGQITMNNAALAAGAEIGFVVNNTLVGGNDTIIVTQSGFAINTNNYQIRCAATATNSFVISVKNLSAISLSDALVINFTVIKGANA